MKSKKILFNSPEDDLESKQISTDKLVVLRKKSRALNQYNKRTNHIQGGINISKFNYNLSILPMDLCPIFPYLFSTTSDFIDYFKTFVETTNPEHLFLLVKGLNSMLTHLVLPMETLIQTKVHLKLIRLLQSPQMIKECLECLINITSFYHSAVFINEGLVEILLSILKENQDCSNTCIWILGNLVGENSECRLACYSKGVLDKVLPYIHTEPCTENSIWLVSNFCKGKPQLPDPTLLQIINELFKVLQDSKFQSSILECLYFCTLNKSQILMNPDQVKEILTFADYNNEFGLISLKIIGNIIITSDCFIKDLIENGLLEKILGFLEHGDNGKKKESLMIISNLAVGIGDNLQFLANHEVFKASLDFLMDDLEELRVEAVWIVRNFVRYEEIQEIMKVAGCFEVVVAMIKEKKQVVLHPLLEALNILLGFEEFRLVFEKEDGKNLILDLVNSPFSSVRICSFLLIRKFFANDYGSDRLNF